jgi:prophage regulatory protein
MARKNREVERLLLDAQQVAKTLGVSKSTLYKMLHEGRFPRGRQLSPARVAWLAEDVRQWISALPEHVEMDPRTVAALAKRHPLVK